MRNRLVILAVALTLLVTVRTDARAAGPAIQVENPRSFTVNDQQVYSVKFLCGTIASEPGLPLAPGTYLTAINVHNLSTKSTEVFYSVNGVFVRDVLMAAGSVNSFDCTLINASFTPSGPFSEGFVTVQVVQEGRPVNVVAVYTTQ